MNNLIRLEKLIGKEKQIELFKKHVLIIGLGGVGGYVCEALARSGIGTISIVDYDLVDETNINRQIIAFYSTIGNKKTALIENRIKDINPNIKVNVYDMFVDDTNLDDLFAEDYDYVVDACDTILTKKLLIKKCLDRDIKFISCMGTGNKFDPTKLEITDIYKTKNDPLARIIRKYCKDEHIKRLKVLSSSELPLKTKDRTPGSTAFVPSTAGLIISSYIIKEFLN